MFYNQTGNHMLNLTTVTEQPNQGVYFTVSHCNATHALDSLEEFLQRPISQEELNSIREHLSTLQEGQMLLIEDNQ